MGSGTSICREIFLDVSHSEHSISLTNPFRRSLFHVVLECCTVFHVGWVIPERIIELNIWYFVMPITETSSLFQSLVEEGSSDFFFEIEVKFWNTLILQISFS